MKWAVLFVFSLSYSNSWAQIPRAKDAPKPKSISESQRCFQLPDDLRIEPVASEPLIADPTAITFDEKGRLFVCELHGYNLEGHLDIVELNKTGKLDRKIRRIPASPKAKAEAHKQFSGTVKLLTDTNGDGRMDRATVWADDLPPCYGMVPARGGLIVICAPDIIFLADRDNDGKPEVRQKLFTGFRVTVMERAINNPRWGIDNWIYVAAGGGGGRITGPHLRQPVTLGDTNFRFKADGSAIEPVLGRCGTFGLALTDYGDRFETTTGRPWLYAVPIAHHYLARNPHTPGPATQAQAGNYQTTYPRSKPHPWRVARSKDPRWVRFYGANEAQANGYFTSACGPMIYRADTLPQEYHQDYFVCEPQQNLVHRCELNRDGAGYKASRAKTEQKSEFLTSTDQWCRPINLFTGPDGAIYVIDMYREIIEDYSAIPRYLQQQYGLIEGSKYGRIWRIVPKNASLPKFVELTSDSLVSMLEHPNAWYRLTAQRLLIESKSKKSVSQLRELITSGETPQSRAHALLTLQGLNALQPGDVIKPLQDAHYAVRTQTLQLAESWLKSEPVRKAVFALSHDANPRVRLQLALTLGEMPEGSGVDTLLTMAKEYGNERWMTSAILCSVANTADALATKLLAEKNLKQARQLLPALSAIIGSRRQNDEIANHLHAFGQHQNAPLIVECLSQLQKGLQRGKKSIQLSTNTRKALKALLTHASNSVRRATLKLAGTLQLGNVPEVLEVFQDLAKQAGDANLKLSQREEAVRLLDTAPLSVLSQVSKTLLNVRQPTSLQLLMVNALSQNADEKVASLLLQNWTAYSPLIRESVIDALFARRNRLESLLTAIEQKTIASTAIDTFRREQLLNHDNAQIAKRAKSIFGNRSTKPDREKLLTRYQQALKNKRNPMRGKELFTQHCAICHQLQGVGQQVGPDLSSVRTRPDEVILVDVLEPSSQMASGFRSYIIETEAGRVFTGVLSSESATSITLKKEKGESHTILRKNIESMRVSETSLMPAEMEKKLEPQDVADILAYLRSSLGPVLQPGHVLFDENRDFVKHLVDGGGKARIVTTDRYQGDIALSITPFQRYSARISGWQYRITEKPKEGEYRYLRLAWKSKGNGVMIELASNGHWPPAGEAIRRYFSGQNTTKWQAKQVSETAPRQWTVITVDLWKDCGSFTLTGIAPTALGGEVLFDRIELLRTLE